MRKAKQQAKGHDTKERLYKYLVVRWDSTEEKNCYYFFYDTTEKYEWWSNELIARGSNTISQQYNFLDVTYLLNEMVRLRGTKECNDLYEIYKKHYKDQMHIQRVGEYLGFE